MNINKTQLSVSLRDKMDDTMPLVVRALTDAAEHQRGASVTIKLKIKFDKKNPGMINLVATAKCKSPKGRKVDLSGDTDDDLLMSFQSSEEQGQQTINDNGQVNE